MQPTTDIRDSENQYHRAVIEALREQEEAENERHMHALKAIADGQRPPGQYSTLLPSWRGDPTGWLTLSNERPGARAVHLPDREPDPNRADYEPPTVTDWLIVAAIGLAAALFVVFGFAYGPAIAAEIGRQLARLAIRL